MKILLDENVKTKDNNIESILTLIPSLKKILNKIQSLLPEEKYFEVS